MSSLPQDGSLLEADLVEALKEDDVISAFFAQLSKDFPEVGFCGQMKVGGEMQVVAACSLLYIWAPSHPPTHTLQRASKSEEE